MTGQLTGPQFLSPLLVNKFSLSAKSSQRELGPTLNGCTHCLEDVQNTQQSVVKVWEPITNLRVLTTQLCLASGQLPIFLSCQQPLYGLKSRDLCNVRGSKRLELNQAACVSAGADASKEPKTAPISSSQLLLLGYHSIMNNEPSEKQNWLLCCTSHPHVQMSD